MTGSMDDSALLEKPSSVRFAQNALVYTVPSYLNLHPDEWGALWYVAEEYDSFNEQCEASARRLENGIRLNPKKHTSLYGLEAWTKSGFRTRMRNRKESLHIVLDEQFAQWDDGIEDKDSIAELYQARCQHAEMVAITRGLKLEREVQKLQAKAALESPLLFSSLSSSIESSEMISPYNMETKLSSSSVLFNNHRLDSSSSSLLFSNAVKRLLRSTNRRSTSSHQRDRHDSENSIPNSDTQEKKKKCSAKSKSRNRDASLSSPRSFSGKSKKQKGI